MSACVCDSHVAPLRHYRGLPSGSPWQHLSTTGQNSFFSSPPASPPMAYPGRFSSRFSIPCANQAKEQPTILCYPVQCSATQMELAAWWHTPLSTGLEGRQARHQVRLAQCQTSFVPLAACELQYSDLSTVRCDDRLLETWHHRLSWNPRHRPMPAQSHGVCSI